MPRFTDLPCEMVVAVFRKLDRVQDLLACTLTCCHFYNSYKAYKSLSIEILVNQAGTLLPFAVAAEAVVRSPSPYTRALAAKMLQKLQYNPDKVIDRLRGYPMTALVRLEEVHERMESFINFVLPRVCDSLLQSGRLPGMDSLSLFAMEKSNFCRAFYRLELYVRLLGGDGTRMDRQNHMFFFGTTPRDIAVLDCVVHYLVETIDPGWLHNTFLCDFFGH